MYVILYILCFISHDQVCVAFNGGKDCTVLLHLFHSLLEWRKVNRIDTSQEIDREIKGLYVSADHPFQQVEDFISVCIQRYNIMNILSLSLIQLLIALHIMSLKSITYLSIHLSIPQFIHHLSIHVGIYLVSIYLSIIIIDFRYNIDLIKIQGSIRSALEKLKLSNPKLKAVLMGTRFSDPYSGLWPGLFL